MPWNPALRPASRGEVVAALAAAISNGGHGTLGRDGEGFLAGLAAEHLADRLELAGFTVMCAAREGDETARQAGLWDSAWGLDGP